MVLTLALVAGTLVPGLAQASSEAEENAAQAYKRAYASYQSHEYAAAVLELQEGFRLLGVQPDARELEGFEGDINNLTPEQADLLVRYFAVRLDVALPLHLALSLPVIDFDPLAHLRGYPILTCLGYMRFRADSYPPGDCDEATQRFPENALLRARVSDRKAWFAKAKQEAEQEQQRREEEVSAESAKQVLLFLCLISAAGLAVLAYDSREALRGCWTKVRPPTSPKILKPAPSARAEIPSTPHLVRVVSWGERIKLVYWSTKLATFVTLIVWAYSIRDQLFTYSAGQAGETAGKIFWTFVRSFWTA
jgi:hypothetical protein